jgi:hypothetical protein
VGPLSWTALSALTVSQSRNVKLPMLSSSPNAFQMSWSSTPPEDYDPYQFEPIPMKAAVLALNRARPAQYQSIRLLIGGEPIHLHPNAQSHWLDAHNAWETLPERQQALQLLADALPYNDPVRSPAPTG